VKFTESIPQGMNPRGDWGALIAGDESPAYPKGDFFAACKAQPGFVAFCGVAEVVSFHKACFDGVIAAVRDARSR